MKRWIAAAVATVLVTSVGGMAAADTPIAAGATSDIVTTFLDLPSGTLFRTEVAWLADAGITRGCNPPDNDRFCPDDPVTRGQMAAFMVRAFNYTDQGTTDFTDDNDSIFETDIEKLAAAGITRGCNPPTTTASAPTTQSPAAKWQPSCIAPSDHRTRG